MSYLRVLLWHCAWNDSWLSVMASFQMASAVMASLHMAPAAWVINIMLHVLDASRITFWESRSPSQARQREHLRRP